MGKIKTLGEIKKIASSLKKRKKEIVFTNGCFDLVHYGHIKYLERCKKLGDVLVVGLNSDSSVKKIKGRGRPVTGEAERAAVIAALEFVDYVTIFGAKTPLGLIRAVSPDIIAKGGDWKKKDIVGADFVEGRGGRVVSVPFFRGYSSTRIIRKIKNG